MSRGPSWRLQFIDIDSSFTIKTSNSDVIGYMVVRAPKGETEGYYVPAKNQEVIEAMFGLPTADYPDIGEAIAFNQEYGLFISAPPGSGTSYPSYYGGVYITSVGNFPFYHVTDKSDPGYLIGIGVGKEADFDSNTAGTNVSITLSDATVSTNIVQGSIKINNISQEVFNKLKYIDFNYWGNGSTCPKGLYRYEISKTNKGTTKAILYCFDKEESRIKSDGSDVVCGKVESTVGINNETTYTIIIGKDGEATNGQTTSGIPFIDFAAQEGLSTLTQIQTARKNAAKTPIKVTSGDIFSSGIVYYSNESLKDEFIIKDINQNNFSQKIASMDVYYATYSDIDSLFSSTSEYSNFIINGDDGSSQVTINGTSSAIGYSITGLVSRLTSVLEVRDDTYLYFVQKSPTEKVTKLTINDIGYDRYLSNVSLPFVSGYIQNGKPSEKFGLNKYSQSLTAGTRFVYLEHKFYGNDVGCDRDYLIAYVYESNGAAIGDGENPPTNVTSDYEQKTIRISGTDNASAAVLATINSKDILNVTVNTYSNAYFFVNSASEGGRRQTEDGTYPYKLVKDINYNTLTISTSEVIYPGKWTAGQSAVQGSLSEEGVDSNGSNIYFPEVIPEDSLSYIEVVVNKTFDEDLVNECFSKERMEKGTIISLQGQRYISHCVDLDVEAGINGCSVTSTTGGALVETDPTTNSSIYTGGAYFNTLKEGWTHANNASLYDCCYVFMEVSGFEDFKSILASLRTTMKVSTIISPKVISKAEFQNTSKIAVAGRMTGTAQYVGEFLLKCPYTSRKYWIKPIGDVGINLCRIIEQKLGGWAPMWNNITGGLGGQLNRSVLKAKWSFTDEDTKVLDEKGLNPIIYNADDGMMIVSQKTTQDPTNLTDWSYLGHTMAFDLVKREIRDNVMRPQIGKPNDEYWQNIRQQQVNAILDKRISGSQPIWNNAVCDIASVNTDMVKAQRKFCIYVKVKVNVFSEIIELTLENVSQTTSL